MRRLVAASLILSFAQIAVASPQPPRTPRSTAGVRALACDSVNALGTARLTLNSETGIVVSKVQPFFGLPTTLVYEIGYVNALNGWNGSERVGEIGLSSLDVEGELWLAKFSTVLSLGKQIVSGTFGRHFANRALPYAGADFFPWAALSSCEVDLARLD